MIAQRLTESLKRKALKASNEAYAGIPVKFRHNGYEYYAIRYNDKIRIMYHESTDNVYLTTLFEDDSYTPYWVQSKLIEKSNCNQYKRPADNLLATAIFDIAVTTNPNVTTQTRLEYMETELKRSIIQMDSEPFQRLVGALSELGLREILMEIMRIRHDSTIEPETHFRL